MDVADVWEDALGELLTADEASAVVGSSKALAELEAAGALIVVTKRSGELCYPSHQFVDGAPVPVLAAAHRLLSEVESPWTSAGWALASRPHPDLDDQSPREWATAGNDPNHLLLVARRDASALAH